MKKIVAIVLSALLLCTSVFALSACDGRIRIAVLQFAQHGSLDNCYEGIVRGLSERGYTEENAVGRTWLAAAFLRLSVGFLNLILAVESARKQIGVSGVVDLVF